MKYLDLEDKLNRQVKSRGFKLWYLRGKWLYKGARPIMEIQSKQEVIEQMKIHNCTIEEIETVKFLLEEG